MKRSGVVCGMLLAVVCAVTAHAQNGLATIRGRVTVDSSIQPLSGVTVTFGTHSTLTHDDGSYLLVGVAPGTDTVRARLIGYAPATKVTTVSAGQTVTVDLSMRAAAVNLSELVSTGYGQQRVGSVTGAVTQVSADQFNTGRIVSPEQLIASKVAGVQVVDNNEPGGGISIRIRGATSINASSDPLYVIDGLPIGAGGGISAGRDALNFLNPNDIESFTVLKGGEAASIYGANAANGVVIITTKAGRQGPPQIEYSTSASASQVTRLPSMLNATQFAAAVAQYAPQNTSQLLNSQTDWFGLIDRTAGGQEHNLSISGAGQSNTYRLSLGYLNQDGIIRGTTTQQLRMGFDYAQKLFNDHLNVRTNLKGSRSVDLFTPGGVLSNAAQMGPTQPVYDSSSTTGYYNWPGNSLQSADNPLEILANATDKGTTYRSVGNVTAAYRLPFFEALTANINLGYDLTEAERQTFNSPLLHAQLKAGTGGTLSTSNPSLLNSVLESYLTYSAPLRFMPGTIDLTGGYSWSQSHGEYPNFNEQKLSTGLLGTNGIPTAQTVQNTLDIENSKLISFFGRMNYDLNDRYLLSASIRRDGSSRFGPANAWGVFPSVAGAWRVSQEDFMKGSIFSDLKLRASWAKTGNQAFANYQQYAAFSLGDAQSEVQFGNTFVSTIRPAAVDPNIKWEETDSYNGGVDVGFNNQRITGSIDVYNKSTSGLIFTVPVAAGSNFSNFLTTNIGSMKNTGVELALSARVVDGGRSGFSWTANFTAARNSNQLTSINPNSTAAQKILTGGIAGGVGTTIEVLEPGQPINSFYVFQQKYDASGKPIQGSYLDSVPGPFHDPAPKWILGHSSYFTMGRWDGSFTLRAWLGNYVYNNVASNLGTYSEVTRGSPYNLNTSVLTTGFTQPQYQSSIYVEDGSFLRMDNVTVGYTFPFWGQPLRLYATVQNAFTITGYSGVDPTAGLNGIDNNIFPRARTWTTGMSIRF